ncbi:imm11 family protein [Microbulbifer thermotolerans]|uniref:Immunity MXAN-0049 protein domain-containing protein n=1 Tax=Microbulbifer thermotolerans TaxID=252514 RepID=A0A143HPK5_MICTH|nr:hypothetical protein [Microbulbifer thermotolerans]AMX03360.1 hypothetical protein A3224_12910 [Microbulbifer thermotolerans]MCX2782996.1 hypothetical protein [Microbulbifer thermotolerans]MCX2832840.1 hypothetical protein [Microbulbifer thermotolerans]
MNLYRLKNDEKSFKELSLDCVQLYEQLHLEDSESGLSDCSDLGTSGKPFPHPWKRVKSDFEASPMYPSAVKIPNISIWIGSALVLSEKAKAALSLILEPHGEFLPVQVQETNYFIFNLFTYVEVDEKKTVYQYSGEDRTFPDGIEKLVFSESDLRGKFLFRSGEKSFGGVFCTDEFKQTCEEFDLDGLIFDEDISNIY